MSVIIVGAGIGGLTAALALARRGAPSVVLERAEQLDEVGAGLQLSSNACRVLFDLGLEGEIRRIGHAPDAVMVRGATDGRVLLENRLGAFAEQRWGAPYLQVKRSALQALLAEATTASGLVETRLGSDVTTIDREAARVRLATGEDIGGEAIIGCDGLNSVVRRALWGETPARFTGQTAWRGLASSADLSPEWSGKAAVWAGHRKHFVHYPVGEGLVNMVAVVEASEAGGESWSEVGQHAALAATFDDWPEPVRAVIAAVQTPWRSALFDRPPLPQWSKGCATLLGDAAHPTLPFLAQGAAMAIEDAVILAECLASGAEVPTALRRYEIRRRARTAKVQAWASRNATLFHLPGPMMKAAFGAASLADRLAGRVGEARFDWLYGYRASDENGLLSEDGAGLGSGMTHRYIAAIDQGTTSSAASSSTQRGRSKPPPRKNTARSTPALAGWSTTRKKSGPTSIGR